MDKKVKFMVEIKDDFFFLFEVDVCKRDVIGILIVLVIIFLGLNLVFKKLKSYILF